MSSPRLKQALRPWFLTPILNCLLSTLFAFNLVAGPHHVRQPFSSLLLHGLTITLADQAIGFKGNGGVFRVGVQVVLD